MSKIKGKFQYDLFLSHSSRDNPIIYPLAKRLRKDGLRVWLDVWEIRSDDNIQAKIEHGLDQSRVLVLAISKNTIKSYWTKYESYCVRFRDPTDRRRRFILLRLDDAQLEPSLKMLQHVDWRSKSEEEYQRFFAVCTPDEKGAPVCGEHDILWLDQFSHRNLNSFVGHDTLCDAVQHSCIKADARLVTLHGSQGIGKTRVGLEVIFRLRNRAEGDCFRDGIAVVMFDHLKVDQQYEPDSVCDLVAARIFRTLKPFAETSGIESVQEQLLKWLRTKHMLLMLDGFENIYQARHLVQELLFHCKYMHVLVTSRRPLQINDIEHVFSVPPLTVPHKALDSSQQVLLKMSGYRLLEARIRMVQEDKNWSVTEDMAAAVTDVLSATSGIPLAIELIAPHCTNKSLRAIAHDLKQYFNRASHAAKRTMPDPLCETRHRSLQACFDYSFSQLPLDSQVLFPKLAVFSGAFTFDAVRYVCDAKNPKEILQNLQHFAFLDTEVTCSGINRFLLLRVLRSFAFELLGKQTHLMLTKHRSFYRDYWNQHSETAMLYLLTSDPRARESAKLVELEHANIFAAIRNAIENSDTSDIIAFATVLDVLRHFGHSIETRTLLEMCIRYFEEKGTNNSTEKSFYTKLLAIRGRVMLDQGDIDMSINLLERSLYTQRRIDHAR